MRHAGDVVAALKDAFYRDKKHPQCLNLELSKVRFSAFKLKKNCIDTVHSAQYIIYYIFFTFQMIR